MSRDGLRRVGAYGTAIAWIVINDDTDWLADEADPILSVTASLVADVFARSDEEIVRDLRAAMKRFGRVGS